MFASVFVLVMLGQQPWHWECGRDPAGNKVCFKVYDTPLAPLLAPIKPGVARAPEILKVPPQPKVEPLREDQKYFFGVDASKLATRDKYSIMGVEVTHAELDEAIGGDSHLLPDDAEKPHLTIWGKDDATRRQLLAMLDSPEAARLRDRYRVQVYDASDAIDHAMAGHLNVKEDARFQESGKAAVVQLASETGTSKVLGAVFAWDDAKDLVEAVPKIDPNFRLPADPKSVPSPKASMDVDPWFLVAMLFMFLLAAIAVQSVFSQGERTGKQ